MKLLFVLKALTVVSAYCRQRSEYYGTNAPYTDFASIFDNRGNNMKGKALSLQIFNSSPLQVFNISAVLCMNSSKKEGYSVVSERDRVRYWTKK